MWRGLNTFIASDGPVTMRVTTKLVEEVAQRLEALRAMYRQKRGS